MMVKQGTWLARGGIWFQCDMNRRDRKNKSEEFKKERKKEGLIISDELDS